MLALKRRRDNIAALRERFSESRIPTAADSRCEKCKSHRRRRCRRADGEIFHPVFRKAVSGSPLYANIARFIAGT